MADIAKLKKKAAEYEQKKQLDKALAEYVKILEEMDVHVDEADVALYNRVGDLMLRQGSTSQAVQYYEKAVDLYTDGGFFNNAIALCNKILRNAPGHSAVHYKLGKISAKKGFINDAKQHFLEYADRMQKEGRLEEAFRALKEFADLCPDQDDIRLMLADQLIRRNRKDEALEQLQILYEKYQSEGRSREARATVERMRGIDPEIEPKMTGWAPTPKSGDLVFLDVEFGTPATPPRDASENGTPSAPNGFTPGSRVATPLDAMSVQPLNGIEPTSHGASNGTSNGASGVARMSGYESNSLGAAAAAAGRFGATMPKLPSDLPLIFPPDEPETPIPELNGASAVEDIAPEILPDPTREAERDEPRPEPAWEEPTVELPHASSNGASEPTLADEPPLPRVTAIDIQLEQSAFLTPVTSNPVIEVSHEARRPNDAFANTDIDAMPELLGDALDASAPIVEPTPASSQSAAHEVDAPRIESQPELDADDDVELLDAREEIAESREPEEESAPTPELVFILPEPENDARGDEPALDEPSVEAPAETHDLVTALRTAVAEQPESWGAHRDLGVALLEHGGDRREALRALATAMSGFARQHDWASARDVARELSVRDSDTLAHHQKHVEFAVKSGERGASLVDAYVGLADALLRADFPDKARAIWERVAGLAPDNARARAMLEILPAPAAGSLYITGVMQAVSQPQPTEPRIPTPAATSAQPSDGAGASERFVNLAEWLREDVPAKSTRMTADEPDPVTANSDFADMLHKFKEGVAANVEETDHESHYDLGVAYKEMGLLDEAIAEFQKALRSTENRVRTYEALGHCFVEKKQYQIALTILSRALAGPAYTDEVLIGVLYLLGVASQASNKSGDALGYFQRVVAVDIKFRDAADRLATLEREAR